MIAGFDSRCPVCDEMIREGDWIEPHEDGDFVHGDCADG